MLLISSPTRVLFGQRRCYRCLSTQCVTWRSNSRFDSSARRGLLTWQDGLLQSPPSPFFFNPHFFTPQTCPLIILLCPLDWSSVHQVLLGQGEASPWGKTSVGWASPIEPIKISGMAPGVIAGVGFRQGTLPEAGGRRGRVGRAGGS